MEENVQKEDADNLILVGVLVPLHFDWGGWEKLPYTLNSWNIHPADLKCSTKVYTNKNF